MHNNNIIWGWRDAKFGAVVASIAVILIVTGNVKIGLAILIGFLACRSHRPAANAQRPLAAGFCGCIFWGIPGFWLSFISTVGRWIAIPTMFLLAMGSSVLASMRPFGAGCPLFVSAHRAGVGLNFARYRKSQLFWACL